MGERSGTNGNWCETEPFPNGAGRSPPPTGGAEQSGGVRLGGGVWSPRPTEARQVVRRNGTPRSSCPTGAMQVVPSIRADVGIGPYGKPNQPPKPAGAQRSVRARGREGWAGIDARIIPKGGPPPRLPGQRLAKRKARKEKLVKFGLCPMISECSTAYHVRKSQHSSARAPVGAAVTEQNSLEPRPAARQGASRARNCAAIKRFFLLTAPPPFSFCRLQKENGGGKLPGFPGTPGRSTGSGAFPRETPEKLQKPP